MDREDAEEQPLDDDDDDDDDEPKGMGAGGGSSGGPNGRGKPGTFVPDADPKAVGAHRMLDQMRSCDFSACNSICKTAGCVAAAASSGDR